MMMMMITVFLKALNVDNLMKPSHFFYNFFITLLYNIICKLLRL